MYLIFALLNLPLWAVCAIVFALVSGCIFVFVQIEEGRLWFQMDCDNRLDILGISGRPINDGSWHTVTLELSSNYTLLSLDDSYVERRRSARAPVRIWPLAADGSLFFGAQVLHGPVGRGAQRPPRAQEGFQGCLGSIMLNGNELPLQNKRSRYAEVAGLSDVKLGCVLYPDPCLGRPCQNGASCTKLSSGGEKLKVHITINTSTTVSCSDFSHWLCISSVL